MTCEQFKALEAKGHGKTPPCTWTEFATAIKHMMHCPSCRDRCVNARPTPEDEAEINRRAPAIAARVKHMLATDPEL